MTQQTINIGSAANDGTGDPLRAAFVKTNGNFTELYAADTLKADKTYVDTQDGLKVAKAGDTMTGALFVNNATASTSSSTGALTVAGGLGMVGNLNIGGTSTATIGGNVGIGTAPSSRPGVGNTALGVTIEASGLLCIGKTSPSCASFNINTDGQSVIWCRSGAIVGGVTVTTTGAAFNTSSDGRLKEDLRPLNDAARIIDATNVYDFAWKSGGRSYGVVAQEAMEVFPAAVSHDEERDWWGTDYSRYVPLLLQELKILRARVAALEAKKG